VTSCVGYLGSTTTNFGSPLPDRNYSYAYDSVGNRTSSNYTGFPSLQENYTTNVLNQYIAKDNLSVPVSGNVASGQVVLQTYSSATTSSSIAGIQGGFWGGQLIPATDSSGNPANSSAPALLPLIMTALQPSGSSTSVNVQPSTTIFQAIPKKSQGFTYDNDGNMLSDGGSSGTQIWTYTYDAENRMKTATEASLTNSPHCYTLTFTYDYLGRRVDKTVTDSVTSPAFVEDRYIYDGWNLVADYRNTSSSSPSFSLYRTYTWGLDVAGSLSASGGVGALLDITNIVPGVNHEYLPAYDGNGNVAALVDGSSGAVVASYEYSPFGETLRTQPPLVYLSTGGGQYNPTNYDPAIADNPFRFSTKFADVQSGLIYYGNRFYSPTLGRFLNRDPIEEAGGINLYGFVNNDPANGYDVLGYDDWGSYRNGLSQSEHDANAVVQYCADGSAIDAAKAGISSGSIQAFAADSDWGGEGYATGSSGEVTACNTMAMDHPTATDTPAATVTAGTPQPAGSSGGNGGSQSNSSGQGGGVSGSGGSNSGGDNSTAEYLSRPAPDGVTRLPAYVINGNGSNDSVVISPASVNANDNDPVRDAQQYRDAKRYPAPKGVYSLSAHGNRYRIRIRGDLWDAKRLAKALLNNPNNKYTKGTAIILYACNTGSGSDNFASQLAHELNVVVTAPNNVGWWDEKADGTVTFDVGPSRYNDKEGNPIPGPDGKYQINQGPQWKMVSFNP